MRRFISATGRVYSSLLELVEAEGVGVDEVDLDGAAQFLAFGHLPLDLTLIKGVRRQSTRQKYLIDPVKGMYPVTEVESGQLVSTEVRDPVAQFLDFFQSRAWALHGRNISVDLTGGVDSRLVAAILRHHGVPFEAAFSLRSGSEAEAAMAIKVGEALGIATTVIRPSEIRSDSHLGELFDLADAQWDLTTLASLHALQTWRVEQGYDLVLTGLGGAMYKDFFWQQDFPFYARRRANLERLYDLRMHGARLQEDWLGRGLRQAYRGIRQRMLERMKSCCDRSNTQTYDQIHYQIKEKELSSVLSHATARYIDVYSPLIEPELMNLCFSVPRRYRVLTMMHRQIFARIAPELGDMATSGTGVTASMNKRAVVMDATRVALERAAKIRKLVRIRRDGFQSVASAMGHCGNSYLHGQISRAAEALKRSDLLSADAPQDAHKWPPLLQGRILTLGLFIERLKGVNNF